mmetsp:Transcript_11785/g.27956  ORF Transcript_11785/g.27956 Transcript_11785/m.27956 type:complete len:599 (-) Transcript_11785:267-2063(-)|eukprot:CAMPEP_0197184080 /NCGR_PEP_ID=MMETSP1423-20130617/9124_1 /TAXON_ID=476441 /ORGANISM="Pseudo-nitzschia heimii, Strain UNC1101" /LENGTH=598 /DNA_ID=CAMNT_0042634803 /DNA_START=21 /DNA_END=1814 /DNA_ORIENTATION=-
MTDNILTASSKPVKFSRLEMEDRFLDGDHTYNEFNYRSPLRTEDSGGTSLIADSSNPAAADDAPSGGGDPHAQGLGGDLKSAVLGIVKGMVGPAILYLPHGFAQAGWVIAIPMLFASTTLYLASSASLLECWETESKINKRLLQLEGNWDHTGKGRHTVIEMRDLRQSNDSLGGNAGAEDLDSRFSDGAVVDGKGANSEQISQTRRITVAAKPSYPDLAKKAFGTRGQTIVKIGIAAMQSGVCLTYLIFVPQNLRKSCHALFDMDVSTSFFLFFMVLVQIPLSWIHEIRHLTVTNALANTLIMYGLITCLGFAFQEAIVPGTEEENGGNNDEDADSSQRGPIAEMFYKFFHLNHFNSSGWFLFIGTSVLLFEGSITLLIPLQEAVAAPQDRQYFPKMYPNVILCIIWFYTFFGIFCWMSFGDGVRTVMTTSLPDTAVATTVQLAYSLAVMLTFPLQNFPSLEIACTAIGTLLVKVSSSAIVQSNNKLLGILQILQRREVLSSLLVCALALVAIMTMDRLDKVVSLMGGLLGCPLAFVFPPLIHNKLASITPGTESHNPSETRNDGYYLSNRRRLQNKVVAILGVFAMVVATIATILKW